MDLNSLLQMFGMANGAAAAAPQAAPATTPGGAGFGLGQPIVSGVQPGVAPAVGAAQTAPMTGAQPGLLDQLQNSPILKQLMQGGQNAAMIQALLQQTQGQQQGGIGGLMQPQRMMTMGGGLNAQPGRISYGNYQ